MTRSDSDMKNYKKEKKKINWKKLERFTKTGTFFGTVTGRFFHEGGRFRCFWRQIWPFPDPNGLLSLHFHPCFSTPFPFPWTYLHSTLSRCQTPAPPLHSLPTSARLQKKKSTAYSPSSSHSFQLHYLCRDIDTHRDVRTRFAGVGVSVPAITLLPMSALLPEDPVELSSLKLELRKK